jgi:predicted urease superfamily metal-dependent hydrolase
MAETVAGAFLASADISISPQFVESVRVYRSPLRNSRGAPTEVASRAVAVAGSHPAAAVAITVDSSLLEQPTNTDVDKTSEIARTNALRKFNLLRNGFVELIS